MGSGAWCSVVRGNATRQSFMNDRMLCFVEVGVVCVAIEEVEDKCDVSRGWILCECT